MYICITTYANIFYMYLVSTAEMKKQLMAFIIDYKSLNVKEKIAKGNLLLMYTYTYVFIGT